MLEIIYYIIAKSIIRAFQWYAQHPTSHYGCQDMKPLSFFIDLTFIPTNAMEASTINHISEATTKNGNINNQQQDVTEFQLKELFLSLTLMDEG